MSEQQTYWFHCGDCGKLYSSEVDFSEDKRCPHCGGHPSPAPASAPPAKDAVIQHQTVGLSSAQAGGEYRSRRSRGAYKFVLVWLVLIAVIYAIARLVQANDDSLVSGDPQGSSVDEPAVLDEHQEFLQEVLPECRKILEAYLLAEEVEERRPLVIPTPGVAARMQLELQELQKPARPLVANLETLKLTAATVVNLPEGETVLTQWEDIEGGSFDAAFRLVEGRWALDWDHFERTGDLSWSQFLAGSGEDVAVFRLHARRRMASKEDPHNGIGVVLSAPMRRHMEEVGFSESMEGLSLSETDGKLLRVAFDRLSAGIPLFESKVRDINPEGMIRVRVRVKRIGEDGGYSYRITKVLACHWYSSEATGL